MNYTKYLRGHGIWLNSKEDLKSTWERELYKNINEVKMSHGDKEEVELWIRKKKERRNS